ncbi:MAG: hypothetical protein IPG44_12915 [Anaerolineales bacterium]|nr:hypothetical protein [Anaerolineales bacterium]
MLLTEILPIIDAQFSQYNLLQPYIVCGTSQSSSFTAPAPFFASKFGIPYAAIELGNKT